MIQKKICLIGAFSVGKTSLIQQFVNSIFSDKYLTTIGVKIDKKLVNLPEKDVQLMIWDIAGEDDFTQINMSYLRGASGFIYVADGTRPYTLNRIAELQEQIDEQMPDTPFVLAVNKYDLIDEWEASESFIDLLRYKGWTVFLSSAKTGESVEELFTSIASKMVSK